MGLLAIRSLRCTLFFKYAYTLFLKKVCTVVTYLGSVDFSEPIVGKLGFRLRAFEKKVCTVVTYLGVGSFFGGIGFFRDPSGPGQATALAFGAF